MTSTDQLTGTRWLVQLLWVLARPVCRLVIGSASGVAVAGMAPLLAALRGPLAASSAECGETKPPDNTPAHSPLDKGASDSPAGLVGQRLGSGTQRVGLLVWACVQLQCRFHLCALGVCRILT